MNLSSVSLAKAPIEMHEGESMIESKEKKGDRYHRSSVQITGGGSPIEWW